MKNLNKVLEKFDECTLGKTNETYERYILISQHLEPCQVMLLLRMHALPSYQRPYRSGRTRQHFKKEAPASS